MKRPKKLSASFVKTVNRPGRYGDGRGGFGLSLLVKPTTTGRLSKTWSQRLQVNGSSVNIGLGAYPVVTLAEARTVALDNRRTVAAGRDPRSGGIPTFAQATKTVWKIHSASWRSKKAAVQWRRSLENHAFPRIGQKPVSKITTADVMGVLLADDFWNRKRATARVVRQRIGSVMKWAVAQGYREDNPAGDAISAALPRNSVRVQHRPALPYQRVGAALDRVRASGANLSTKLCVELLVLTACRSGEVRQVTWSEFDLEKAIWTIPEDRTKSGRKHRVPLSTGALRVLEQAKALATSSGVVFPGLRGRPISEATLGRLFHRLDIGCVPHGMRSSFRDWCSDTGVVREVAEASLAHVLKNKVEAAYARSDLLDRRREVMEAWAQYVAR